MEIGKIQNVLLATAILMSSAALKAQNRHSSEDNFHQRIDASTGQLTFQKFSPSEMPARHGFEAKLTEIFSLPSENKFEVVQDSKDQIGMQHERLQQTHNGIPVFGAMVMVHSQNGLVSAVNGKTANEIQSQKLKLAENEALEAALQHLNAIEYQWEVPGANAHLRRLTGITASTWYPLGKLMYVKAQSGTYIDAYRLAWKFDIYASQPLFRRDVFVDAENGEIIFENDRLCIADAQGLATTRFSGVQTITTDSTGPFFRLRESGRAQGVETYNMLNQTNYGNAVDFTDSDNVWDVFVPAFDNAATDAHWGAEMTFDYFNQFHGRNSYDDQGSKLISFVHYDNSYSNAFWNGIFMTYGDGGSNNNPFCGLDVCGHEFAHGVTEYTAGLVYSYESGALNESFSDIFGNAIEFWARPGNASWLIGDDIGAFRSMSNPNIFLNPDTYLGTNWATGGFDNGGVHINSGVQNYWYYLLVNGGSGTNDNGDNFNVQGIGFTDASAIAYRNLATYLGPNDQYSDARYYSIQAAIDLFGECSPQMIATMDAWYAVGLGNRYTGVLEADFYTADTALCTFPVSVAFQNRSFSATNYRWDFGDGGTSTLENPTHTYNSVGNFNVRLIAYGCNNAEDTLLATSRVIVDLNLPCNVNVPANTTPSVQAGCDGRIYDSGGSGNYLPNSNGVVTIDPASGQQVLLNFTVFNYAAGDRITIFDGPSVSDPVIGTFAGTTLPTGIVSTNGAITIRESTNGANEREGFVASWSCVTSNETRADLSTFTLFPNPNAGKFQIEWKNGQIAGWEMEIFSSTGKLVQARNGNDIGQVALTEDISQFAKGIYFVTMRSGELRSTQKLIVQ